MVRGQCDHGDPWKSGPFSAWSLTPHGRPGIHDSAQIAIAAQSGVAAYRIDHFHAAEKSGASAEVRPISSTGTSSPLVGRDGILKKFLQSLDPEDAAHPNLIIVTGAPGVGKTELTENAASRAVRSGWFQRAAFFIDLQGYNPDPTKRLMPAHVYPSLLRALGLPPEDVPSDEGIAGTVYHQLVASRSDRGQELLLVLDNAADIDQIRPLLFLKGRHRVVVTSRDSFGELTDAVVLEVPTLGPDQALDLMQKEIIRRRPDDLRVANEPAASLELARLCDHLPLALKIVSALLSEEPERSPADLVEDLKEKSTRLHALSYSDSWGVRRAFDLSYFRLTSDLSLLFALLPLIPGPVISVDAAASLVSIQESEARRRMTRLARAHLIEKAEIDQWRIHDLLRIYASEQTLPHAERDRAFNRLLEHYQEKAEAAAQITQPTSNQPIPPPFKSNRTAEAWFHSERPALVNMVIIASTDARYHVATVDLARSLSKLLSWTRHVDDQLTVAEAANKAAQHLARPYKGAASDLLGQAFFDVRQFDSAIPAHQRAVKMFAKAGDRPNAGIARAHFSADYLGIRNLKSAWKASKRAIKILRHVGSPQQQAMAFEIRGTVLLELGKYEEAAVAFRRSHEISQQCGDLMGQAGSLNDLSLYMRISGRLDEAIAARRKALRIYERTGNRWRQAMLQNNLGSAFQYNGQPKEAAKAHDRAARLYRILGDRYSEAKALNNLCVALRRSDQFHRAIEVGREAVKTFRDVGDHEMEAMATRSLAAALSDSGEGEESLSLLENSIQTLRHRNELYSLAQALETLGIVQMYQGQENAARASTEEAISIFGSIGKYQEAQLARIRLRWLL
jgi:tetratricopeptide (TPR) repeat protein